MNPCHTIPTMADGPDFHLFEAAAILQYIANKYQLDKCMFVAWKCLENLAHKKLSSLRSIFSNLDYPTTLKERALADFMLTFRNTRFVFFSGYMLWAVYYIYLMNLPHAALCHLSASSCTRLWASRNPILKSRLMNSLKNGRMKPGLQSRK